MTDKLKMYNGYVDDDYDHINTSPTPPTAEDAVNAFVEDEKARLVDAIKETAKGAAIGAAKSTRQVFYPTCRFCGTRTLPDAPYDSQEDADEAATMRCDCVDARFYQAEKEREERRKENIAALRQNINALIGYCDVHNIKLDDVTRDFLIECGTFVLDKKISKATVNWARFKISFALNNKDIIVISYAYTDGGKIEV